MKIKIGNDIIDSEKDSFMIIIEPHEKNMIANLGDDNRLLLRPEGIAVTGMNTFHKWNRDFTTSYNKKVCDKYIQSELEKESNENEN